LFRKREAVLDIFAEHKKSGLSIKAFCDSNNIAAASFHNWKKRHGNGKKSAAKGFAPMRVVPSAPAVEGVLFAEVKGIRIYQRVEAVYQTQLLS